MAEDTSHRRCGVGDQGHTGLDGLRQRLIEWYGCRGDVSGEKQRHVIDPASISKNGCIVMSIDTVDQLVERLGKCVLLAPEKRGWAVNPSPPGASVANAASRCVIDVHIASGTSRLQTSNRL